MSFTADRLLLFGATGDLSQRMLLPSLCALHADRLVSDKLQIVCTARSEMDDTSFRDFAAQALDKFLPEHRKGAIPSFLERLYYQPLDANDTSHFHALAEKVGTVENGLAIFLSTAPSLFEPTIAGLVASGLANERSRIGLEKPLGIDLPSSKVVNDAVAGAFTEDRIFRIDHYLGKETVQNLLALRFANIMFEPLWNATHIEHVQITVAETVGLEGRVGFYDGAGALRDMVQNHMLQLLALVAMEPPARFDPVDVRGEKTKVLNSLRKVTPGDIVTGQYVAGAIAGGSVPGYIDELALEGRALLPAHRQAPAQAHHRDRRAVPPRAPFDVRPARRGGQAQPSGHRHPARREHHAGSDDQGARPRSRRHPPARGAARHPHARCFRGPHQAHRL
jgi:glucose-6-phosphate 1-dehydrogenase